MGALGGLWGSLLSLQIDTKGLTPFDPFALWALLGLCFWILAADDYLKNVLECSWAHFCSSLGLLGAMLVPLGPLVSIQVDVTS